MHRRLLIRSAHAAETVEKSSWLLRTDFQLNCWLSRCNIDYIVSVQTTVLRLGERVQL
uniref:Uncharacterized protein n=1 Tax=Anguilla anguilla TaxID=7936 RepID=A0A0E9WHQ6_ANGAN